MILSKLNKDLPSGNFGSLFLVLITIFPVFFTFIKSWSNGISFVLVTLSLIQILRNPKLFFHNQGKIFWLLTFSLVVPFISEFIVQTIRGPFEIKALDGPCRFILGAVVFVYLSRASNVGLIFKGFLLGSFLSLIGTLIFVNLNTEYYWAGRCATNLLCPNALPVYTTLLGLLCLFNISDFNFKITLKIILLSIILASTICIGIMCETRTVWVSFIIVSILYVLKKFKNDNKLKSISFLFLFITLLSLTIYSPKVRQRIDYGISDINSIKKGELSSPIGIRIGLICIDIYLMKENIFFGYPDGNLPEFSKLKKAIPFINKSVYDIRATSGAHCEFTAHLARKGLLFGGLTVFSVFFLPLLFLKLHSNRLDAKLNNMSFCIVLFMSICALGVQVFGLKMTSTFWAVFLALYYSKLMDYKAKISTTL